MRIHKITFAISVAMVVGSILLIAFKGFNFGVDFAGGILMEVKTEGPADLGAMRDELSALDVGEVALQEFGSPDRSEEHTSELQSLMRISYAVFCLKKKKKKTHQKNT